MDKNEHIRTAAVGAVCAPIVVTLGVQTPKVIKAIRAIRGIE